jgi:hypothetical protein
VTLAPDTSAEQVIGELRRQFERQLYQGATARAHAKGRKDASKTDVRAEYRKRHRPTGSVPRALAALKRSRVGRLAAAIFSLARLAIAIAAFGLILLEFRPPQSPGVARILHYADALLAGYGVVQEVADRLRKRSDRDADASGQADTSPRAEGAPSLVTPDSGPVSEQLRRCSGRMAHNVLEQARPATATGEKTREPSPAEIRSAWSALEIPLSPPAPERRASRSLKALAVRGVAIVGVAAIFYATFTLVLRRISLSHYWQAGLILLTFFALYLTLVNAPRAITAVWHGLSTLPSKVAGQAGWLAGIPGLITSRRSTHTEQPLRERRSGRRLTSSWAASVESTADRLEGDLLRASQSQPFAAERTDYQAAQHALHKARDFAKRPDLTGGGPASWLGRPWRRAADWWTGYHFDMARAELHTARQALLQIEGEEEVKSHLADMAAAVVSELTAGDLRINAYLKTLDLLAPAGRQITPGDRAQLREIRKVCDDADDSWHADARSFRNALILAGSFLILVLAVVAVAAALDQSFRTVFAPPSGAVASAWYVLEIELIASLSGLTGAVLALRHYSGFRRTYGLPSAQAILKGSTAAVLGLLGVILMRSGIVPRLKLHSTVQIFGVAIIFGFAQYLFTRLLDQRARDVLKSAGPGNDRSVPPRIPAGSQETSLVTTESPANRRRRA